MYVKKGGDIMDKQHRSYLSINAEEFERIKSKKKHFVLYPDDKNINIGHQLVVTEITDENLIGRTVRRTVKSVQRNTVGLARGWCIIGW